MRDALVIARQARETGDVPVGAIIVNAEGVVIGTGSNEREANNDPTAHAEIVAIRNASSRLQKSRLDGCTLIVTLEPCAMCAGAIAQSRISHLVYGAWDEKAGGSGLCLGCTTRPTLNFQSRGYIWRAGKRMCWVIERVLLRQVIRTTDLRS